MTLTQSNPSVTYVSRTLHPSKNTSYRMFTLHTGRHVWYQPYVTQLIYTF